MGGTCVTFSRIYLGLVLLLFISSCVGRIGDDNFDRPLNETQRLRRLEEIMGSPTSRRLCVRALSVLRADLFKTQIPDSDTDVYMSCMSCTPTRLAELMTPLFRIVDASFRCCLTLLLFPRQANTLLHQGMPGRYRHGV